MKVRATTSFSVESSTDPITYDYLRAVVTEALSRLASEHDLVDETSITPGGDGGRADLLVVELDIVFRSDSYGAVDDAMLKLAQHIASVLETEPTSPRIASRETQLVPA